MYYNTVHNGDKDRVPTRRCPTNRAMVACFEQVEGFLLIRSQHTSYGWRDISGRKFDYYTSVVDCNRLDYSTDKSVLVFESLLCHQFILPDQLVQFRGGHETYAAG